MRRSSAQSMTEVSMAPDWLTSAMSPARGIRWAKLALIPAAGEIRPRQFGPTIRMRWGRAASSTCWRRVAPSTVSPRPAEMTMAAQQPRSPSAAMMPGTVRAGVAITARSGTSGSVSTERWHCRPWISRACGLTSMIRPAKPPETRLSTSTEPTDPGSLLAPISAIERGANSASKLRMLMRRRPFARLGSGS